MNGKISLAGDLGSGKSTVSKILIERLSATYYSTGAIVRAIAEGRGMSVVELNRYMETHPEIDHEIDDGIARLSDDPRTLIIDSRMAWHFTKGTFKVYLSTDIETSALRIMSSNRTGEHAATLEETIADTRARRASEKKRYFEQYGVDIMNLSNYDVVIDTTYATPDEVAEAILTSFALWQEGRLDYSACLSPERLLYPEDQMSSERAAELSTKLDDGQAIPPVRVTERDGKFYVVDGAACAMAYALSMATYVPAHLCDNEPLSCDYIEMKNSL